MIAIDLECSNGHRFEGWFSNLQAFEEQNARELVSCPTCEDIQVRRVPSPPAIMKRSFTAQGGEERREPDSIDYHRLAKEIVHYIHHNFEDVGTEFTKEALKMHYGVTEKRSIRGSASAEEEKTLQDENIQFFKIPMPRKVDDKQN